MSNEDNLTKSVLRLSMMLAEAHEKIETLVASLVQESSKYQSLWGEFERRTDQINELQRQLTDKDVQRTTLQADLVQSQNRFAAVSSSEADMADFLTEAGYMPAYQQWKEAAQQEGSE